MAPETLGLTKRQRLGALEWESVALRGKMKMRHGILKQQRHLINESITGQFLVAGENGRAAGGRISSETLDSGPNVQKWQRRQKENNRGDRKLVGACCPCESVGRTANG